MSRTIVKGTSKLKGRKMKGQFFVLGAILICSLFFIGVPKFTAIISEPSGDLQYITLNLRSELSHAHNIGVNSSSVINVMKNFTHFVESSMLDRGVGYSSVWVLFKNTTGTTINITAGNFFGENVTINIDVDGTDKNLTISNGTVGSTTFSSVPLIYNVTISLLDQEETAEWPRYKNGLFAFFQLIRGNDIIKNTVIG